jgi:chemotaxis protein MotB
MKMNRQIKYSKGDLAGAILPLLILTAIAGVGWYLFYDEQKSNQAFNLSSQKEKKNLDIDLKRSQSNIDTLESRRRQLDDLNKSLTKQIDNHQQVTENLNQRISQLENSLTELRNEHVIVQGRNAVFENNLLEMQDEQAVFEGRTATLEDNLAELRNERAKALNQNATLEGNLTELRNERAKALSRNAKLENNLAELQNELAATQELSDFFETSLAEEQKNTELAQANTARLENDMQQMIDQVSVKSSDLKKQLEQRQAQQASLNLQIDSVSEEKQALLHRLQDEQQRRLQLQDQVAQVNQDIDSKAEALSDATQGLEQLQSTLDEIRAQKDREAAEFAALKKQLEQELNQTQVQVIQLKNQMRVINLTSEVLFNSGSAEIKPAGQKVLALIASTLNNYPNRQIFIEGHTDDVPIGKNSIYRSNWELSSARAISAVEILQENNQVSPERLKVVGHGEFKPVTSNATQEGRRLNRRIEIRLLPESAGLSG